MIAPFDIFRLGADGHPVWVEAVPTLDAAKIRVQSLGATFPGQYMIFSQKTGNKISITVDRKRPKEG